MSVISRIVENPHAWAASDVIDVVFIQQYDEPDRRRDLSVPLWLRQILTLGDLDTQLQMEGLLGWWENAAAEDLDLVCDALIGIGLTDQAELLRRAERVLKPSSLSMDGLVEGTVSSFSERHPGVSEEEYAALRGLEHRLWYLDPNGADLSKLLLDHAARGLDASA